MHVATLHRSSRCVSMCVRVKRRGVGRSSNGDSACRTYRNRFLRWTRSHQDLAISAPPALFSWGARALYIGPALGLSAHRNAVAVLAVGLDAQFALSTAPA